VRRRQAEGGSREHIATEQWRRRPRAVLGGKAYREATVHFLYLNLFPNKRITQELVKLSDVCIPVNHHTDRQRAVQQ
jgi:hypothetical protein